MEPNVRVVMLAGNGRSTRIIYHSLSESFDIPRVLIEDPESRTTFVRRRVQRLGFWTVVGQILFVGAIVPFLTWTARDRIRDILEENSLEDRSIPGRAEASVPSANAEVTKRRLRELDPDVVVINGTRILSPQVLEAVDAPFLNLHAGLTPRYRGVHGGYWALVEGNEDAFGATVHVVDEGIDTGGVLQQVTTQPTTDDNFVTYPLLQLAAGLPALHNTIERAIEGVLEPTEGREHPSKLWSHPTALEYLKHRVRRGVR